MEVPLTAASHSARTVAAMTHTVEEVEAEDERLPDDPEQARRRLGLPHRVVALLSVLVVAASTVLASQLTKDAQTGLNAPFFVTIVHTGMIAVCGPPSKVLARSMPVVASCRDVVVLLPFWIISSYCFVAALSHAPAGLVQTLFGTAPAVVAILSKIFLKEACTVVRMSGITLAFLGTLSVSTRGWKPSKDSDAAEICLGLVLAMSAVLAAACYKVAFKMRLGEPLLAHVLGCLATLGLVAGLLGLPVCILLSLLGVEDQWWHAPNVRWTLVLASGAVDVLYQTSVAWGLALASPTLVALGVVLGIPANLIIDAVFRGDLLGPWEIIGAVLIVTSFTMLAWFSPPKQPELARHLPASPAAAMPTTATT